MNKGSAISSLKNEGKDGWVDIAVRHIGSDGVHLLSGDPGSYVAEELIADYQIRREAMKRAGIEFWGVDELMSALVRVAPESIVHNYIFEGEGMASILYFDEDDSVLIGATTIAV